MLDLKQDFFALFGPADRFSVDMERLEQAYLDIQGKVHPDRFAHLPDLENVCRCSGRPMPTKPSAR
jgi:molecular chaperone HscB